MAKAIWVLVATLLTGCSLDVSDLFQGYGGGSSTSKGSSKASVGATTASSTSTGSKGCTPTTCAKAGIQCGPFNDGCEEVACGDCMDPGALCGEGDFVPGGYMHVMGKPGLCGARCQALQPSPGKPSPCVPGAGLYVCGTNNNIPSYCEATMYEPQQGTTITVYCCNQAP